MQQTRDVSLRKFIHSFESETMHSAGLISTLGCETFSFSGNSTQWEGLQPGSNSLVHNRHLSSSHLRHHPPAPSVNSPFFSLQVFSLPSPLRIWILGILTGGSSWVWEGKGGTLWAVLPERGQTEHCMSFYCTCLWMVQFELVFRCKCLPVLFLTRGIRRSAFLDPIRIFSLNVDVYRMTLSEEGQMNELHHK